MPASGRLLSSVTTVRRRRLLWAKRSINLDEVKVGDAIKAAVKAELSVYILDHDRLPNADGTSRPKTTNFNAKVLQVDSSNRLLTLKFTNGHIMTIKAGPDVMLEKMAAGDNVVMRSSK